MVLSVRFMFCYLFHRLKGVILPIQEKSGRVVAFLAGRLCRYARRARFRAGSVLLALDPTPLPSDTPVLLRLGLEEVGVI